MNLRIEHTDVFTRNYRALLDENIRFIINQGGSRSSKTYSILQLLVWYSMTHSNKRISICRKTGPALRASVYQDFIEILVGLDIYSKVIHNKGTLSFEFSNGTKVRFFSIDTPQKLRGLKHDIVYANEANELSLEEFTQLNMRTSEKVLLDWNPSDPYSFIVDIQQDKKSILIHSTYKDNPFLTDSQIREIENLMSIDDNFYKIYALGEMPIRSEIIFKNIEYSEFPLGVDFVYGLDFGYNDPTALVKVSKGDGTIWVQEVLYESYLTTELLIKRLNELNVSKNNQIFADSARPDQIESIRRAGYSITKSDKKINEGLDFMKMHKLKISPNSKNLIKEIRSYSYKKLGDRILDTPVDFMNHAIDATRYASMSYKNRGTTSFFVV